MNTKVILTGVLALAAAAVAPVVIGRFGGELAGLLRVDVLTGFGVVATLVALITLEYRNRNARTARQPMLIALEGEAGTQPVSAKVVTLGVDDTRAAA